MDYLVLDRSPQPLDEDVVTPAALALPSMLMARPRSSSARMNSRPLNWLRWSVFMISGLPKRTIAYASASTQKSAVRLLAIR